MRRMKLFSQHKAKQTLEGRCIGQKGENYTTKKALRRKVDEG